MVWNRVGSCSRLQLAGFRLCAGPSCSSCVLNADADDVEQRLPRVAEQEGAIADMPLLITSADHGQFQHAAQYAEFFVTSLLP